MIRRPARTQAGFALPLALGFLAVVIMAAGFLAGWTERAVDTARQEQARQEARLAMASTAATLRYMLATRPMNIAGLRQSWSPDDGRRDASGFGITRPDVTGDELRLDGHSYRGLEGTRFALQDEGGLVGLNRLGGSQLQRLLARLGVEHERSRRMVAALRDYTDPDDLRRLNGAERADYRGTGLPPPANQRLRSAREAQSIRYWADRSALWQDDVLVRHTTVLHEGGINLNTSPLKVLQSHSGLDRALAERLVAARPHATLANASSAVGKPLPLSSMSVATLATKYIRLTLYHPDHPRQREVHLELTPTRPDASPWESEYALEVARSERAVEAAAPGGSLFTAEGLARP